MTTPSEGDTASGAGTDSTMGLRFQWIRRVADPHALARTAADEVLRLSHEAIAERGVFRIALAGGSTPRALYEELAAASTERFEKWHFYWGDERYVPPTHADSNFLMAQQTLLGRVPVSRRQVHRVRTEVGSPSAVAEDYEDRLRYGFGIGRGELPRFDCILLGLGADGHTASLFPGSRALDEQQALVVAPWVDAVEAHRITLTLPVLNAARAVIFLVSGEEKAAALREVLDERGPARDRPARLVCPREGTVLWVVDRAAAGERPDDADGGGARGA